MPSKFIKNKRKIISIFLVLLSVILIILFSIDLIPVIKNVVENIRSGSDITSNVQVYGWKGVLILMALQALQVITILFPSAAIQIFAGLTYGIFFGLLICLAGYVIGNTIVFMLIRRFGNAFFPVDTDDKKIKKKNRWAFALKIDPANVDLMVFLLFLMPGIPNGILPYIFAKTSIPLLRYLIIILLAGTPAILICTLVGERVADGDILTAVIAFGIFLLIALVTLFLRNRIIAFIKKKSKMDK